MHRSSIARIAMLSVLAISANACTWAQYKYGSGHSGYNPDETTISVSNVNHLGAVWRAPLHQVQGSSPTVANGTVYLGGDSALFAFDAGGKRGCSTSSPPTCSPLWQGVMEGDQFASPAVVGGVAYAVSESPGQLHAFDAAGAVGCTGTPKICSPLWSAGQTYDANHQAWVGDDLYSSPVVANGVVYVQGTTALFAYDAAGKRNCSGTPRVCVPLWRTHDSGIFTPAAPVVANGFVYAGLGNGEIGAYDAQGAQGCGGTPKICSPQRILLRQGTNMISSPAIVNGVLYVGGDVLSAYDVSSTAHCTGTPLTCMPIWTASTGAYIGASPSVANGVVYVGSYNTNFYAFDAAGLRNCGGVPKVCNPLWFASTGSGQYVESPAAIANGLVYVGAEDGTLLAFDAAGRTGCNAGRCFPIWSVGTGQSFMTSGAAVVDGTVYWTGADSVLRAYRLQPGAGAQAAPTALGGRVLPAQKSTLSAEWPKFSEAPIGALLPRPRP